MDDLLLKEYTAVYKRISDGREFLCRNITPNDCRLYDTIDKTFESMSTTKRSKFYKKVGGTRYHSANKKKPRVSGAKVRDLRRAGHEIIGGRGDWE
jgi:hypothetical protein